MWQNDDMGEARTRLTGKLVDALYTEALLLADEARAYFEDHGREAREALPPILRVGYAVESLKVTTRIMHVVAWLLNRRAVDKGEIGEAEAHRPERRLGAAEPGDEGVIAQLPNAARLLIEASEDLHARVARIEAGMLSPVPAAPSPARALLGRLERAF